MAPSAAEDNARAYALVIAGHLYAEIIAQLNAHRLVHGDDASASTIYGAVSQVLPDWHFDESMGVLGDSAGTCYLTGPGYPVNDLLVNVAVTEARKKFPTIGDAAAERLRVVVLAEFTKLRGGLDEQLAKGRADVQDPEEDLSDTGQNQESEAEELRREAESGDADAQFRMSELITDGATPENPDSVRRALHWLEAAAAQGHPEALFALGEVERLQQNERRARELFQRGAESGHLDCQHNLALMFHEGIGGPRDYEQAYRWFRKAAEHGETKAQYSLALMYERGTGCRRDLAQSEAWLERAAANGHADAKLQLSVPRIIRRLRSKVF